MLSSFESHDTIRQSGEKNCLIFHTFISFDINYNQILSPDAGYRLESFRMRCVHKLRLTSSMSNSLKGLCDATKSAHMMTFPWENSNVYFFLKMCK